MKRKILVLVCCCLFALAGCKYSKQGSTVEYPSTPGYPTAEQINSLQTTTPSVIVDIYQANAAEADATYSGKWAKVYGTIISDIEVNNSYGQNQITLSLGDIQDNTKTVTCTFAMDQENSLNTVKKGQNVTIMGELTYYGHYTFISLEKAFLVKVE